MKTNTHEAYRQENLWIGGIGAALGVMATATAIWMLSHLLPLVF